MSFGSSIRVTSVPQGNLNSISYGILKFNLVRGPQNLPYDKPVILKFDTGNNTDDLSLHAKF